MLTGGAYIGPRSSNTQISFPRVRNQLLVSSYSWANRTAMRSAWNARNSLVSVEIIWATGFGSSERGTPGEREREGTTRTLDLGSKMSDV
jgi:hypothetical protein